MRAGPKGAVTADPLTFKGWPTGRAKRRERFIAEYLITPKGVGAREPFRLRPFQRDIVRGAFALGVRTALVSIPRANGKSALASSISHHYYDNERDKGLQIFRAFGHEVGHAHVLMGPLKPAQG